MSGFRFVTAVCACVVLICGVWLSVSAEADRTEYYFDYVNGSDEDDGTKAGPPPKKPEPKKFDI